MVNVAYCDYQEQEIIEKQKIMVLANASKNAFVFRGLRYSMAGRKLRK
jgi:hypothetical protein